MELTETEKELIKMFRELTEANKEELFLILKMKYENEIKRASKAFRIIGGKHDR